MIHTPTEMNIINDYYFEIDWLLSDFLSSERVVAVPKDKQLEIADSAYEYMVNQIAYYCTKYDLQDSVFLMYFSFLRGVHMANISKIS